MLYFRFVSVENGGKFIIHYLFNLNLTMIKLFLNKLEGVKSRFVNTLAISIRLNYC